MSKAKISLNTNRYLGIQVSDGKLEKDINKENYPKGKINNMYH